MNRPERLYNFNAGPAQLPYEVLEEYAAAALQYRDSGMSVLEIPHRGKLFTNILDESRQLVKELCGLDDDYEVLWMQGGGRLQFAMVPMHFLPPDGKQAVYIDSGRWARDAADYAKQYGRVSMPYSSAQEGYRYFPMPDQEMPADAVYMHLTTNNTIYGTQCPSVPLCDVPLIADMSSDILSRKTAYRNCALFYATAQKNLGAAGVTLVVIHKSMLEHTVRDLPEILSYKAHVRERSVLNTPPVSAIYLSLLMLRWIRAKGIDTIEAENRKKASLLYEELDRNPFLHNPVDRASRSMMNVIFTGTDAGTEQSFFDICSKHGIAGIEGHRSVGAFRVSLYNSIPMQQVQVLVDCMKELEYQQTKL